MWCALRSVKFQTPRMLPATHNHSGVSNNSVASSRPFKFQQVAPPRSRKPPRRRPRRRPASRALAGWVTSLRTSAARWVHCSSWRPIRISPKGSYRSCYVESSSVGGLTPRLLNGIRAMWPVIQRLVRSRRPPRVMPRAKIYSLVPSMPATGVVRVLRSPWLQRIDRWS